MKKNKILTLVALGTLSVGVVAGGVALSTADNFIADAGQGAECELRFDKNSVTDILWDETESEILGSYIDESYTRIFTDNLYPLQDINLVTLDAGQTIYNTNIDYTSSNGWGSTLNGLTKIGVNATGEYKVYTAYDETLPYELLGTYTKPTVIQADIAALNIAPRFFKIEAVAETVVKELTFGCTMKALNHEYLPSKGIYEGTIQTYNYGTETSNIYKNQRIELLEDSVKFYEIANGELVSKTYYAAGKNDSAVDPFVNVEDTFYAERLVTSVNGKGDSRSELNIYKPDTGVSVVGTLYDADGIATDIKFSEGKKVVPATSIDILKDDTSVKETTIDLEVGSIINLTAKAGPYDTTDKIKWTAENANVTISANENNCKVTAAQVGTSKVTVKAGNVETFVTINVTAKEQTGPAFPQSIVGKPYRFDGNGYIIVTFSANGDCHINDQDQLPYEVGEDWIAAEGDLTITDNGDGTTTLDYIGSSMTESGITFVVDATTITITYDASDWQLTDATATI